MPESSAPEAKGGAAPADVAHIAENLARVRGHMAEAAKQAGRPPAEVVLVAVSKTHGADAVAAALANGQRVFGENRVQEAAAKFPHVTSALADLRGITLAYNPDRRNAGSTGVNHDVVALAQRFAQLMSEYNLAIGDGKISSNEAKRMLRETLAIQQVLLDMKLNLEDEAV